jgi:peptidoglycan/xylan/chitin deacetylase (PgdA/CDA1 family)
MHRSKLRHGIKEAILQAASRTGVLHLLRPLLGGFGSIFCMHRVLPHKDRSVAPHLSVTSSFLEEVICHFLRNNVRFSSIHQVQELLTGHIEKVHPFVALTFDDGYRDNLTNALPILRKYKVPATIYVPSGAPDRFLNPWWLRLERALLNHDELVLEIPGLPRHIPARTMAEKRNAYAILTAYVHQNISVNQHIAMELLPQAQISDEALDADYFLSWAELLELVSEPLITIGGHTITHAVLSELAEQKALDEMSRGRDRLVAALDTTVEHFAYPYGAISHRDAVLAKKAGFKTAVTLRGGNIFPEHRGQLLCLPRFVLGGMREDMTHPIIDFSGARVRRRNALYNI